MSTVNLYDILNLPSDCTKNNIRESFLKLVKQYHPDKENGNEEMFELVTHAYNILINEKTRQEYDDYYKLSKEMENDHFSLKNNSKSFIKGQVSKYPSSRNSSCEASSDLKDSDSSNQNCDSDDNHSSTTDIKASKTCEKILKKAKKNYWSKFKDLDKKHNLDRKSDEFNFDGNSPANNSCEKVNLSKKITDLEYIREQDDIENFHDKIFDETINPAKFNAVFDKFYKNRDENTSIIPHKGNPEAWDNNISNKISFCSIDNYDKLYLNDDENDEFFNDNFGKIYSKDLNKHKKISKDDVDKIDEAFYTSNHNYKDSNYTKTIEEKIKEREQESKKLDTRTINDFDMDSSCGGYGITDKIKKVYANIDWDSQKEINEKIKRLHDSKKLTSNS